MQVSGSRHIGLLSVSALLLAATAAWAIEAKREVYVINTKPPSVAVLDTAEWRKVASIPLAPEPTYALTDRENRFLYVLHKGLYRPDGLLRQGESELAVIDLVKREQAKKIPLAWGTSSVVLSRNGNYLLCVSQGKTGKKKAREEFGSVTVVDTRNNEVVATLSTGRLGVQAAVTGDLSRIAVLSLGEPPKKKGQPYTKPMLTIFTLDQEKPLAEIELERAAKIALSRDEKWLYVLNPGFPSKKPKEHKNGVVHVVDLAAARIVADHDVGALPQDLVVDDQADAVAVLAQNSVKDARGLVFRFNGAEKTRAAETGSDLRFVRRLGDEPGLFTFAREDMRFLPDTGAATTAVIALNPKKKSEAAKALGGIPGEVLYLPGSKKAAITVRTPVGAPTSKVAIVNLADNKVEHVVTTGRGSVKFGKFMGAMALSVAMSSMSYYAGYSLAQATGSPYFFYNIYTFTPAPPNLELSASPDGKFVYALNSQTNDVTIINVQDGTANEKIAVGGGCRKVASAPGGRFIYSFTGGQVNLIDTQSNKKHLEHQVQTGRIRNLHVLEEDKRLVALTSKALVVLDVEKGAVAQTIEGFDEPYILVQPAKPAF